MRKLIGYCLCVATVYLGGVSIGLAGGGTFTRGCAGRDIQVMMMLETSGMSATATGRGHAHNGACAHAVL